MPKISEEHDLEIAKNRNKRLQIKLEAIRSLPLTLCFITLTLSEKGKKDRYKRSTIENCVHKAIKDGKPDYYLMIYETHKDGAWHSHLIAPILDGAKIVNHYKSGFYYIETVQGNTYNELAKYIAKSPKGKRAIYCSEKLNQIIKRKKEFEKRNQTYDCEIDEGIIEEGE